MTQPDRIVRLPEVEKLTGMNYVAIYDQIKKGLFPKQVRLTTRTVGWRMSEIQEWIATRETAA